MRKTLLSLAVLLLSSSWASAQIKTLVPDGNALERQSGVKAFVKNAKKAAPKKTLAENQVYVGPYDTDDLAEYGLGLTSLPGTVKVASILSNDMLSKYKGAKVVAVRVGLCEAADGVSAFLAPISESGQIGSNIFEQSIPSAKSGWNQVAVNTNYTIGDDELLLGFAYTQTSTGYPISTNEKVAYDGGFLCYANLGSSGLGWYNMGTSYGSISIQLIVEKDGGFSKLDGKIEDLYVPAFVKDGKASVLFNGSSCFGATFKNVEYGVKLNGTEIGSLSNVSAETGRQADVTGTSQVFGGNVTFPAANLKAIGEENELNVYIKSIDGKTPENTEDDALTTKFKTYTESVDHQKQLVEHFTSQYCTYCPLGITILETLTKQRNDIAWVSIHGNMSGGTDIYTISDAAYYMNYATTGFPSATFNRYYLANVFGGSNEGSLSFGLGYNANYASQVAQMFSSIIDQSNSDVPAFTSVEVATTYDEATKKLGIKVTGEGVADVKKLLGDDAVLTVYLTEDGLVAKQYNQGSWVNKYTHNNVLRKIVSAPLGDVITWDGNKFEKDYDVTLNSAWNAKNMNVVAFVSSPLVYNNKTGNYSSSVDDVWVDNTNSVKVGSTTGINGVVDNSSSSEVARYSLDGMQLSAPQKGLNIVKLSDGRTVKVMVK